MGKSHDYNIGMINYLVQFNQTNLVFVEIELAQYYKALGVQH